MLTSVGRAAARRVVRTSSAANRNLTLSNTLAGRSPLALRPAISVRSFSVAPWSFQAAKSDSTATKGKKKSKAEVAEKSAPKKKPKKKPNPVGRPPKPKPKPTEEQVRMKEIRALKEMSLVTKEPNPGPGSAWTVFLAEKYKVKQTGEKAPELASRLASEYHQLSSSEKERHAIQGEANKKAAREAHAAWIAALPVEDIYAANVARRRLKNKFNFTGIRMPLLKDERIPKKPLSPYLAFSQDKFGDQYGSGSTMMEVSAKVSQGWQALSESEKQAYDESYRRDLAAFNEKIAPIRDNARAKIAAMDKKLPKLSKEKKEA